MHEIHLNLAIRTLERHQWRLSNVLIVIFAHISQIFILFLLFIFKQEMLARLEASRTSIHLIVIRFRSKKKIVLNFKYFMGRLNEKQNNKNKYIKLKINK